MFELTDQAFTRLQPLLAANSRRGRPCRDHRQVLGGIIWKLHTGRPWRDVPERFGPWQTCYSRLRRWQTDGTWPRIWVVVAAGEHGSGHDCRGQALGAAAPVAAPGAGLMAATPPRPPQHLPHAGWRPPHQPDQQPPCLRGRDSDQVRAWRAWRLWQFCALSRPPLRPGRGPPPGTPGRPAPGWCAGTRRHSGGPGSGPGRPGPCRPGSTPPPCVSAAGREVALPATLRCRPGPRSSAAAAGLVEPAAVTLGGAAHTRVAGTESCAGIAGRRRRAPVNQARGGQLGTDAAAGQPGHLHDPLPTPEPSPDRVTDVDRRGRLGPNPVDLHVPGPAGLRGQGTCLHQPHRPQPAVDPGGIHAPMVTRAAGPLPDR
jgi:transposase